MFRKRTPARIARAGTGRAVRAFCVIVSTALASEFARAADAPAQFQIKEGRALNAFHQQGPVSAHFLLSDGTQPRLLIVFPAGNSGVGIWFEDAREPVYWQLGRIESLSQSDDRGRALHGVVAEVRVDAPVVVRDAVLSSVRVLRDYQLNRTYPPELKTSVRIDGKTAIWARERLDGAPGYALSIALENGELRGGQNSSLTLSPSRAGEALRLKITALTGETPLNPLGSDRLLNATATDDLRSRQVLNFLSYEEKFLAGSWRFNTYFGRDTLMSLRLLMPALQPEAIEGGLASVLQRLRTNGEVAHEEDIGEFAVLRHRKEGDRASNEPIYDYNMIDDDFMLAPVAAEYLLEHARGRDRAERFLARRLPNGDRAGEALARNFVWVTQSANAFAQTPKAANLISLKPGLNAGQWRDSQDGLGGGRYPFDVNAVLVPAALSAISRFVVSGVLEPYLSSEQQQRLSSAERLTNVWSREAPKLFDVRIGSSEARQLIAAYAKDLGVNPSPALEAVPDRDFTVSAIALDASHKPIPILHSDGGFALLLQNPPAAQVEQLVATMLRPFPAGLLTDAGLLVANPVFADRTRQQQFGRSAYHGTVVWSWQQALLAAGLEHQLARDDLREATSERLREARRRLWSAIERTRVLRASELWSWRFVEGRYQPAPFGQSSGDADESNAAQLWSTVYLAVRPPAPAEMAR